MVWLKSNEIFGGTSVQYFEPGWGGRVSRGDDADVSKRISFLIEAARLHVRCCRSMSAASVVVVLPSVPTGA